MFPYFTLASYFIFYSSVIMLFAYIIDKAEKNATEKRDYRFGECDTNSVLYKKVESFCRIHNLLNH